MFKRKRTNSQAATTVKVQNDLKEKQQRQREKLKELLTKPDTHLEGVSEQWWDEFEASLRAHKT